MKVTFTEKGSGVSDFLVPTYVQAAIDLGYDVSICQATVMNEFRLARKDRRLNELVFIYKGEEIECKEDGRLNYWPTGFADIFDRQLDTLLGLGDE